MGPGIPGFRIRFVGKKNEIGLVGLEPNLKGYTITYAY